MQDSIATRLLADIARDPILTERETTHGSFEWNAFVSQRIKAIFRNCPNYEKFSDPHKESLDMIALKLSRLLQNPEFEDHWLDLAGYANLGLEFVEKTKVREKAKLSAVEKAVG